MSTTAPPRSVTPEDLLQMGDDGKGFELVKGELREVNMSTESDHIAGEIYFRLKLHCVSQQPGWVLPEGTSFRCFPDDPDGVRRADVSYITLSRMTPAAYRTYGHCCVAPDLVAEVISPRDNAKEVADKIQDWLGAGVRVVWEVYPANQTVRAHRPDGTILLFRSKDTLTAEDVLPGFACPVADLFRLPGEPLPAS